MSDALQYGLRADRVRTRVRPPPRCATWGRVGQQRTPGEQDSDASTRARVMDSTEAGIEAAFACLPDDVRRVIVDALARCAGRLPPGELRRLRVRLVQAATGALEREAKQDQRRRWHPSGKRCGAYARSTGKPCKRRALRSGRCLNHGGLSSGPRTLEGRRRVGEASRERVRAAPRDERGRFVSR